MRPRGFAIAFALALITSATVHAAPVIATTVEGAEHSGALSRLDARTVELQDGETTRTLSWDELTALTFDDALNAAANPRQAAFYLADGGRLTGTLIAGDAAGVGVRGEQAVDWEIPWDRLGAIHLPGGDAEARALFEKTRADPPTGKDVLIARTAEGPKVLRGMLVALTPQDGEFRFAGRSRRFSTAKVEGVVLGLGSRRDDQLPFTLELANGDAFTARDVVLHEGNLRASASYADVIDLPRERVRGLRYRNPRVLPITTLPPQQQQSRGIVHPDWVIRFDRNVFNGPLRISGKTYDHGLGMHARAQVTYALAGGFETFAATIGIDDVVRPHGKVRFIVRGDGKSIFDSGPIAGTDPPRTIAVPVEGVQTLTLLVEPADDADIGDWANWADARLIRPRSAP